MIDEETKRYIDDAVRQIIGQFDVLPDAIKQRHIGEGVRFIRAGLAADRPTSGEKEGAFYYATDTFVLSGWTGSAWKTTTLA